MVFVLCESWLFHLPVWTFLYHWLKENKCAGESWSFPALLVGKGWLNSLVRWAEILLWCGFRWQWYGLVLKPASCPKRGRAGEPGAQGHCALASHGPSRDPPQLPFRLNFHSFTGFLVCSDPARGCYTCPALVPNALMKIWTEDTSPVTPGI